MTKLFFASDIDGTLLTTDGRLTERTLKILSQTRERGHYVTLATGRSLQATLPIAKQVGVNAHVITLNGAQVVDGTGRTVMQQALFEEPLKELCALLEARRYPYCLMTADWFVVSEKALSAHSNPAFAKRKDVTSRPVLANFLLDAPQPVLKLSLRCPDQAAFDSLLQMLVETDAYEISCGELFSINLTAKGVTKWTGIEYVIKELSVAPSHVVAFGNGDNDLEMLRRAGRGYAVANAEERVLRAYDCFIGTNDEDGVAIEMERIVENLSGQTA
ncbi:Cof-type HAD-IIB family hydrolase [Ferroacidibacillus organovorans]|uniref:Hydrolase n=1 Tax=Ferroacidibacillus organovorans TaxID=1765683 RepID=A0A162UBC8_9BACL|nr:Cof-type HAD-IIB family hydrolase [Ferroacidibacillus organovorans]KYP81618.1 hypothetical protein AYJ22_06705 [Ferroacidibacillus organovorans]OAG94967.1 hypothetical protein AYW79_02985 [Ferroacidibacillus organovorans]OPG14955.1 hypothetical protein B2M26_14030 [Ferroacidibacillus organovorans]